MAEAWALLERLKQMAGGVVEIAALSPVVLYLFGYLSLRYKLTVLGIGTDLSFLDERYLFEGVRFLTYLVTIAPNLLLITLLVAGPVYLVYSLISRCWPEPVGQHIGGRMRRWGAWWRQPPRLACFGIIFSLLVIQILMRKVFQLSNVLVTGQLAREPWVNDVLLNDGWRNLYFHGLVAATLLTGYCLLAGGLPVAPDSRWRWPSDLLAFLFAVQVLLLPINYGGLVSTGGQSAPRVSSLDGVALLPAQTVAWLVWEGHDGLNYLVHDSTASHPCWRLLTLPKNEVKRLEIIGYDHLLYQRFQVASACMSPGAPPAKEKK